MRSNKLHTRNTCTVGIEFSSNDFEQMFYGDVRVIAYTAGFLLVDPERTLDATGSTYCNSVWGGTVDDIGFTGALIDSIAGPYSVNTVPGLASSDVVALLLILS
jgi:hypothetical protein